MEQAAGLVAGITKLLSQGLTTFQTDRETGAKLFQQLNELEVRLRNRGPGDNDSLRAALAGLEAELHASRQMPATVEARALETALQTVGGGAATRTSPASDAMDSNRVSSPAAGPDLVGPEKDVAAVSGKLENAGDDGDRNFRDEGSSDRGDKAGMPGAEATRRVAFETPVRDFTGGAQTVRVLDECASSLEQFDRLAREFQRPIAQPGATKSYRAAFEDHGTETPILEKSPGVGTTLARSDALTRQIETSRRHLAARLEAGLAADAVDMNARENLAGSAGNGREFALDRGEGQHASAALEREIAKLALRFDRVGEGLASLTSLEGSIGSLSIQLDEMRRIVDSLSNAVEPKPSNGPDSFEDAQSIMREIAGLQALHEETAQRTQLALTAIQESLQQVAGYCARLEAAASGMRPDRRRGGAAPEDPFAPILSYIAQYENPLATEVLAGDGARGVAKRQPAVQDGTAAEAGFLIEPGLGFPGRGETSEPSGAPPKAPQVREEAERRTDFIAAARRAARTAQLELDGAAPKSLAKDGGRATLGAFLVGRSRGLFIAYKRKLILGATLVVAAIGAFVLAKTLAHNNSHDFVPAIMKHTENAAEHGNPAGAVSQTLANMTPKGRLPAIQARLNELPADRLPAAGVANTMTDLLNPSRLAAPAEPGFASDSAAAFGKASPATRAIAGSDAVVAGPIRPSNIKSFSAPPAPPAATVPMKAPSEALAASPQVPAASQLTARAVSPAVRPNEKLFGQTETGSAAAQFDLAVRYAEGGAGPRNYELAAQWYEKAAQQGLAVAEYRLASLCEKGLGVAKDMQRAKDLYQRAAEKGNTRAMHNLGVLAAEGSKPNYTSAAMWFGKAAEYGIRDSQYNLAVLLARGLGLPKDLVKSYTWFAIVAAAGDAEAARKRDEVAARLTSSELAAANAAAAGFAPRQADRAANEIAPPLAQREAAPAQGQPVKPKVSGL